MAKYRTTSYKNKRGGITMSSYSPTRTTRTNWSRFIPNAYNSGGGDFPGHYVDYAEKERVDSQRNRYHTVGKFVGGGVINKRKTPEQIEEQMKRIAQNFSDIVGRDQARGENHIRKEALDRIVKAATTVQAYRDYNGLGAKGNSNG